MSSYILSQNEYIDILNYINEYRNNHDSNNLVLDDELTKEAQNSAISMLKKRELNYTQNNKYSEVLYCNWACRNQKIENIKRGIDKCYNESKLYNYKDFSLSNAKKCKNFTALIWKKSTKIGIGYAYVNAKCVLVLYLTSIGNIPELYSINVLQELESEDEYN